MSGEIDDPTRARKFDLQRVRSERQWRWFHRREEPEEMEGRREEEGRERWEEEWEEEVLMNDCLEIQLGRSGGRLEGIREDRWRWLEWVPRYLGW